MTVNQSSLAGRAWSEDHNCTARTMPATRRFTRATRPERSNSGQPPLICSARRPSAIRLAAGRRQNHRRSGDQDRQAVTANVETAIRNCWTQMISTKPTTISARTYKFVIIFTESPVYHVHHFSVSGGGIGEWFSIAGLNAGGSWFESGWGVMNFLNVYHVQAYHVL